MRVHRLVGWMDRLTLRVCHQGITLDEINDEERSYEELIATRSTLIAEIKDFGGDEPWIVGLDLDTGKVVALPWWYFEEVKQ